MIPNLRRWLYRLFLLLLMILISIEIVIQENPERVQAQTPPFCVTGDFTTGADWDNTTVPLYDDGTHGDAVASDGIHTSDYLIEEVGGASGGDYYEWKIVECGSWATSYPASDNAWFFAQINDTLTFSLDTNTYADGAYPATNIHNVDGDTIPAVGFTAVGDWQGWNNANAATAMTDMGGGIWELSYVIPTAGNYLGKVSATGFGDWHGFGGEGRQKGTGSTPVDINFTTTADNQTVLFRLDLNSDRLLIEPQVFVPTYCTTGDFTTGADWDNTTVPLYDDGTHGDAVASDGIHTSDYLIEEVGGASGGDYYEWKIVECGSWATSYPASDNAWFFAQINDTLTFSLDTNTYADGAYPATNIHNVDGDTIPAVGFTAVGDWQGWNNANAATAMTDMGGGIWELSYVIPTAGNYLGKVSATGFGDWHGFGGEGRQKGTGSTPTNISFTTTADNQTVLFRLDLNSDRLLIEPQVFVPTYCTTGDFTTGADWDNTTVPLYDDGTHGDAVASDGIHTSDYLIEEVGGASGGDYYEWKIVECGSWATSYPASDNAWFFAQINDTLTFSLDTNTYADGAYPATNIHNVDGDTIPAVGFTAVGDWQGWNNANAATAMTDMGGGIWELSYVIPTAGNYLGKVSATGFGDWHGFGGEGRQKGTGSTPTNISFTTTADNQTVLFRLDLNSDRLLIEPQVFVPTYCTTGDFTTGADWDNTTVPLYDDGTHGDAVASDGIHTSDYLIEEVGGASGGDYYEWKIVECGSWATSYPASDNAWFFAQINDTLTFSLDTNTYADGAYPATNIHNVDGDTIPAVGFTAVGDWQGWNNANAATAMTDMGGGIWELSYVIPTAGNYLGKVSVTGFGDWHGFGGEGRQKGTGTTPTNINFATGSDNETVTFRLDLNTDRLSITTSAAPPVWCIAGSFQSPAAWDNAATPLNDNGTDGDVTASDGIFSTTVNIASSGFYEWKAVTCGDWSTSYPNENSWFITTTANEAVIFTFDTNFYNDGFFPQQNIVHTTTAFGSSFDAAVDGNSDGTPEQTETLTDQGGGIYSFDVVVATPGNYAGWMLSTGQTYGWGVNGRSVIPAGWAFATSTTNEIVVYTLDNNTGRIKIEPTTAPPTVWDSIYHSSCHSRVAADCSGAGDHAAVQEVPSMAGTTFSSVQTAGSPVGDLVTDVFAYDDDPITMYMLADSGELTDDDTYPYIRYWIGSENFADMDVVGSYTGDWNGRTSIYDIISGQIPPLAPNTVYYWLTAQESTAGTTRSMCVGGNPNNAIGQSVSLGDCSFNDYAFAVLDDDTSGPDVSSVVFDAGGDGIGNGNDQVCADVVETGTDSGDNDSNVGTVELITSATLGDVIVGNGTRVAMTFVSGNTYCASGMSFSDPTYYRVEASNDDEDHPADGDYTDIDINRSAAACEGPSCNFPTGDDNINWGGVWHDTRDDYYRSPFGAVPTGSAFTLRLRTELDDVIFAYVRTYNGANGSQLYAMSKVSSDGSYDYWETTIDAAATATIRQLYYKFVLIDGTDEDWYIDDHSHNEYDHEDRYENGSGQMVDDGEAGAYANNAFTVTVYDANFGDTIPDWAQQAVIYQIMPDRFRNGDPSNDAAWPAGYDVYGYPPVNHATWNEAPVNPRDSGSAYYNYWSADFFGGDLQGIMDELDYLQSLGVTAIYLNPIFSSPSNHGYDTTDYMNINPRYGDNALFALFAAEAQARGIYIILDGVFNHSGSDSVYFDRYSRWDANGNPFTGNDGSGACEAAGSGFASFFDFIASTSGPCYSNNDYDSWFGYDSLPLLIDYLNDNTVRDFVFDVDNDGDNGLNGLPGVIQFWYGLGADGWRFDVANEIPHDWWVQFRDQVKGNDGLNGPLYSEVWFEAQPWVLGNELDATMNYRYRKAVLGFLIDSTWTDNDNNGDQTMYQLSPTDFDYVLNSIREDYAPDSWMMMMNLMGSHDTNRALFVLREQSTNLDVAIDKLKMMAALQFTYPGAPTIYYGDEAAIGAVDYGGYGLWGAGYDALGSYQDDPYNRHPFPWNPNDQNDYNSWTGSGTYDFDSVTGPVPPTDAYTAEVLDYYTILATTRNSYPVLQTGDVITVLADDGNNVYAYVRVDATSCAIAIFNRNTVTQSVTLNGLPAICSGTFEDVLNNGADWTTSGTSITVNNIGAVSSAVLVPALGQNGLGLPPANLDAPASDSVAASSATVLQGTGYDIAGQTLPTGVTIQVDLVSGAGNLSSATAVTNAAGEFSVTYNAPAGETVAVIQFSITGTNGVTYKDSTTLFVAYGSTTTATMTQNTTIGPEFVDGFSNSLAVAATKVGTGEPVVSLAQFDGNPHQGTNPVASAFVDVHVSSATDVDMVAIRVQYTDEIDEANHELFWWDGNGWIAVVGNAFIDTAANELTFEATPTSSPSIADLNGTVFVVEDPGFYDASAGGSGGFQPTLSKAGAYGAGSLGLDGDTVVWTITVSNESGAAGTGVTVIDTVPTELEIVSATSTAGVVTVNGQSVVLEIATLNPGESVQLTISTTILSAPSDGQISNTTTLSSNETATASATAIVTTVGGLPDTGYPPQSE